MKKATGKYQGVRAITKDEALAMIPMIFTPEFGRAGAGLARAWAEFDGAWAEFDRVRAEFGGYSPEWRAINFIAADRRNAVYCFVYCSTRNRNELWIYDGKTCPNAKAIKKRGQVIWAEKSPKTPLP